MKKRIYNSLLMLLLLTSFTACKKEVIHTQQNTPSENAIDGKWNLTQISGGIAGLIQVFAVGEIEWTFNTQNGTLTVNNTSSNPIYYYLPSGTYNFQEVSNSGQHFLVIEADELGQISISGNQLQIDQNKKSTGEGACGFYMELNR
jgi:restriction endonuclease S subunit